MEKSHPTRSEDIRPLSKAANCTCSFCLLVFSMKDPTEANLSTFRSHLQRVHGLKVGEPEP